MQNGPLDLIVTDCENELFRRIWPAILQKAVFSCKLATRPDSPSLWKRIISPYLARNTPKSPKSRTEVQNGPLDLIRPVCEKELFPVFGHQVQNGPFDLVWEVCEKELFRFIWPARLRKAQKPVFRCKMAHSTWFSKFVKENYFALLEQQDSKNPKK